MYPKLIELLSWNGPTVHVCCFMLARASTKTFVSRIHIRQPSPKNSEKSSLAEKFVSSVIRQPRYHCISKIPSALILIGEIKANNFIIFENLAGQININPILNFENGGTRITDVMHILFLQYGTSARNCLRVGFRFREKHISRTYC